MITVITETGDHIILSRALVAQGDAAVEAYVADQRKTLKLPVKPLHFRDDAAKIADLIKKRNAPPAVIEAPAKPDAELEA